MGVYLCLCLVQALVLGPQRVFTTHPIHEGASAVNGIKAEDLKGKPTFKECARRLHRWGPPCCQGNAGRSWMQPIAWLPYDLDTLPDARPLNGMHVVCQACQVVCLLHINPDSCVQM
jgi:hypothetical protein